MELEENTSLDFIGCIFLGDCYNPIYEYTFLYDGIEYKSDDCYRVRYGSTVCKVGEEVFTNVSYTSKYLRTEHTNGKGLLHFFAPFLIFLVIYIIFRIIFEYLFVAERN